MGTGEQLRTVKIHLSVVVISTLCSLCLVSTMGMFVLGLESSTCSLVQGRCRYDPRTQQPARQFIKTAPEQFIVQYIRDQVKQSGMFPPGAGSKVASITPVLVQAGGFHTDWHVQARVTVEIRYVDGRTRQEIFELLSQDSSDLLGIDNTLMAAEFGAVRECDQGPSGGWYCHM